MTESQKSFSGQIQVSIKETHPISIRKGRELLAFDECTQLSENKVGGRPLISLKIDMKI